MGGGLVIKIFNPTEYDMSNISIKDELDTTIFNKVFTQEETKNYQGIEIKLASSELNNTTYVTVYVDGNILRRIGLHYSTYDLSKGIWQYEAVWITW